MLVRNTRKILHSAMLMACAPLAATGLCQEAGAAPTEQTISTTNPLLAGMVIQASAPKLDRAASSALELRRPSAVASLARPVLLAERPKAAWQDESTDEESPSDRAEKTDAKDEPEGADSAEDKGDPNALKPLQGRVMSKTIVAVDISLADIGTGLVPGADAEPAAAAVLLPDGMSRGATFKCVHWVPSQIIHHPLYFEEAMLERHGHVRFGHLQPLASGVQFFGRILMAPYLHTLRPACDCEYAIGHYRPGSCAPVLKDHLPWDKRAAAVQTLSTAAFFWAMPL